MPNSWGPPPSRSTRAFWNAVPVRVIDGDTVVLLVHLRGVDYALPHVRLAKLNAPELNTPDNAPGVAAHDFVMEWLGADFFSGFTPPGSWPLWLYAPSDDDHGRWLGQVFRKKDGRCLNADLIAAGHAEEKP